MIERTFVAIKPDGVKRGLIGKIIERLENKGYKIIGMKMLKPSIELAHKHYAEHVGKPFFQRLINYLTSAPIIAMVFEGENAISGIRHIMGATRPDEAEPGTIRCDFAIRKEANVIHGSDSPESAKREIEIWFNDDELYDWQNIIEIMKCDNE